MTIGTSARADRRGVFLRALSRCGSVTKAARAAGVWPATAYDWRKADDRFAAAWAKAVARGRAAVAAGNGPVLGPDEVVRGSRDGRPCVARVGATRWSAASEERFLHTLAATCCVRAATQAAGVSSAAVYKRRDRWPDFAARWHEALVHGWHELELALLRAAKAPLGGAVGGMDVPFAGGMTVDQALTLFKIHRHRATGEGPKPRHNWRRREPTIEEVRAEVLRRVRVLGG